jgi:2-C-methyl-D-erythritol 2,4-cyclodiphosphate synthase
MSEYRIGTGEDIHKLVSGRKLILCGVLIPFDLGLLGHSDADVAYHAVADSLLGALGLGDIGQYFPPSDPKWEGVDSLLIVKKALSLVKEKGWSIANIDVNIVAQEPRLAPYIEAMKTSLARSLETAVDCVSVKAMTNEGLDAVGRAEAIRATAVALLIRQ